MYIKYLKYTEHDQTQEDNIDRRLRIFIFFIIIRFSSTFEASNENVISNYNCNLHKSQFTKRESSSRMGNYTTVVK